MFKNFMKSLVPRVKAQEEEEELVDPQQVLRDECRETAHCKHLLEKYEECNNRVNSKTQTAEICSEELFDFLHAIDHCVTPKLFPKLK